MTDTDLQRQLEDLKQQVATLAAERTSATTAARAPSDSEVAENAEQDEHAAPLEQVEELVHLLEKELRESPVVSGLAIFAAGVLVGRLLR